MDIKTARFPYLKTQNDAIELAKLLDNVSAEIFNENALSEEFLKSKLPNEIYLFLAKSAKEQNIDLSNKNSLQAFLLDFQKDLLSLPVVHIILAIRPTRETIEEISDWFFDNFKKLVLLDITTDESLIAGAALSFNGLANEYSLRNRISQTTQG